MQRQAELRYIQRRDRKNGETYYQHRAVAAWKLAREPSPAEVVHHADGNPRDNHPENVWILSTQRARMLWHH